MNKRTTGLLMGICISALAASFSTAVAFANADVAEQEQTASVLTMQEGASIRYMKPVGIRFVTDVATDKYNDIIDADSEAVFGTLIIPKEFLGNTVITADNYLTIGAENIVAKTWLPDTKTTKSFACALGGTKNQDGTYNNFPEKYYNADLYAVSYCSYKATVDATKNTVIFAKNPQTYSVAYIASALQAKGDTDAILSKITDSVLGNTMAFASETYVMCKGDTLQTVLNAKGLKATYSTDNETIATVNEDGVVTGVGAGTAQITAKIGNKTAIVKLTVTDIGVSFADSSKVTLAIGEKSTREASVTPDTYKVVYSVKDGSTDVITVDAVTGEVTANAVGSAVVVATVQGYDYATAEYEVEVIAATQGTAITTQPQGVEKTYNGSIHTLSVTVAADSGKQISYQWYKKTDVQAEAVALQGATVNTLEVVNVADSGLYYCVISDGEKNLQTDTVSVAISKIAITLTADSGEQTTDTKTPLVVSTYKLTGTLAGGHKISNELKMTSDSTLSEVGTRPNKIDKDTVKIVDGEGKDVTANYEITLADGTLTVRLGSFDLDGDGADETL